MIEMTILRPVEQQIIFSRVTNFDAIAFLLQLFSTHFSLDDQKQS